MHTQHCWYGNEFCKRKIWLSMCLLAAVRFARYCSKMYCRRLFQYGHYGMVDWNSYFLIKWIFFLNENGHIWFWSEVLILWYWCMFGNENTDCHCMWQKDDLTAVNFEVMELNNLKIVEKSCPGPSASLLKGGFFKII